MHDLAAALNASDYHQVSLAPTLNCFGGTIDIEELLALFTQNGLSINAEHGESALRACANLEYSKCTQEEFLNVMKEYCGVHRQLSSVAHIAAGTVPVVGAAFGLMLALVKVSNSIKDRANAAREKAKTAEIKARYLRGLATADNLSVEATTIAVVMQEIMARSLDDFETVQLNASSSATVQMLREDLLPYLESLSGKSPEDVKVAELRAKRWEIKQRLIRQFEIVSVHANRVEQGLAEMRTGLPTYYMKTNRIVSYARECLLEIHLRAWLAMMGYFDAENTMIENDDRNVGMAASERLAVIQSMFEQYADARLKLLKYKYENKREVKGSSKHDHSVSLKDNGAESDTLVPRLSIHQLMLRSYISCQEPEGGGIDHFPDGSCEIWNDNMFSSKDRCSSLGQYIDDTVRRYVKDQMTIDGPVWVSSLGFVDRMRRAVQPSLPDRPTFRASITAPSRLPTLSGPITVPSRIPMVQAFDHEPTPHQISLQSPGYCHSVTDSHISSDRYHDSYS